ncbi:MAG TPA: neutral/alkaline non-lysosomal ceramidase N-terminal domain-containing protein [Bacteroidales bacterium]|nr:neutral/alkaline non-lysosomal ceramidase N-terminal domain-containing protein [Bacteroidales bacterium]
MKKCSVLVFCLVLFTSVNGQFRAGVARKSITPDTPMWLSGYASRTQPSTGVQHDIWVKALAIEDNNKNRIVIVTTDILGLSHDISEEAARRVIKAHGMERSQLLMNSSHTHSAPVIWPALSVIFDLNQADQQAAMRYAEKLTDSIVEAVALSFADMVPAQLSYGRGEAGFSVNRREATDKGVVIGINAEGPVDHSVPVLKVTDMTGKVKAILFGYTCHNTTSRTYLINGDYSGFAQLEVEKMYPDATAMYIAGCGADQNPNPRGTLELAAEHGKTLADAVGKALNGELITLRPPVRTSYTVTDLHFKPVDPAVYRNEMTGSDIYMQRRARLILEAYNKGWDMSTYKYPVQAVRFNKDFTILGLTGEVVIDYAIAARKRFPGENMFVAGYCTEVQCYIPSKRILSEGGYEPESSMIYYGFPGPFSENVEEKVMDAVTLVMKRTGAKR